MKTWGMIRLKNEARWIDKVIRSIQPVCDQIVILDDHSTDGSAELCEELGCTVFRSEFDGIHEARDKDYLLSKLWELGAEIGDAVLHVDGDEALHPADIPALQDAIRRGVTCGSMKFLYLWDREDQYRADRWYSTFTRPSLFRLTNKNLRFQRTDFGGNFHCSSAPAQLLDQITRLNVRLLHYGYLHKEDRIRKYYWYNSIDPGNSLEDGYRHFVIGDLFPANSAFRWAGPLELKPVE